ncbi:CoA-transferase family III domain-containing protein [Schizophyllum amplum]|uniref:CoA-transferase family III domain-containing protein n=1 Tax=Schizophyllum amplum TaxID=97359 RepID=A0A550CJB6_9AGAR|nr:CoA-transferase family III domain-containing protein [Auriculariopsis ampla]
MALAGVKVIEFAGLAPAPYAGIILADYGASVVRVDRPDAPSSDVLARGKRSIAVNPKTSTGRDVLKKLIAKSNVLIDPYRPGVLERLGLGPDVFLGENGLNPKLVYARIVGFPTNSPQSDLAGHDINYLALSGVLAMLPGDSKPTFPINLLADFAGGGLLCALGIVLALRSGQGQVVQTDMVSGARYVGSFPLIHKASSPASPLFTGKRGENLLDGGAPFYAIYICKDGGYMSVGCLEPQFYAEFIRRFIDALPAGFAIEDHWRPPADAQTRREAWPQLRIFLECGFATQPRDFWANVFQGSDACAFPVLSPEEAAERFDAVPTAHPTVVASDSLRSAPELGASFILPGTHTDDILKEYGIAPAERYKLLQEGALGGRARM